MLYRVQEAQYLFHVIDTPLLRHNQGKSRYDETNRHLSIGLTNHTLSHYINEIQSSPAKYNPNEHNSYVKIEFQAASIHLD